MTHPAASRLRKNAKAQAMYDMYCEGHSVNHVAHSFNMTRGAVYQMFARRGYCLRERETLPVIVFDGRKYTLRQNGYYGATSRPRGYLHRHIWENAYGPVPAGHDIHHRDGDPSNNCLDNLECLSKASHSRLHYPTGPLAKNT